MGDKKYNARDVQGPTRLVCHHCGAENPPKAYCCITCFKVLRPKSSQSFWQFGIRPSIAIPFLFLLVVIFCLIVMKNWVDTIEGRVSMDLRSTDYNISVVAHKQKKKLFGSVQKSVQKSDPYSEIDREEGGQPAAPAADQGSAPSK